MTEFKKGDLCEVNKPLTWSGVPRKKLVLKKGDLVILLKKGKLADGWWFYSQKSPNHNYYMNANDIVLVEA